MKKMVDMDGSRRLIALLFCWSLLLVGHTVLGKSANMVIRKLTSSLVSTESQLNSTLVDHVQIDLINDIGLSSEVKITGISLKINGNSFAINGQNSVRCFNIDQSSLVITALTIKNGFEVTSGGGFKSYNSTLKLRNCSLISNYAANYGGGMFLDYSSMMTLNNCYIFNNTALYYSGGGIYIVLGTVLIVETVIESNHAAVGGGVSVQTSIFNCTDCTMVANSASTEGGAIFVTGSTSSCFIDLCSILKNTAVFGGGLFVEEGIVSLLNSTITANEVTSGTFETQSPTPSSSILWPCRSYGGCFSSSNFPSKYNNDENCSFVAMTDGVLEVVTFLTEPDKDILTLNNISYSGVSGPDGVAINEGDDIYWESDSKNSFGGFEICFVVQASGGGIYIDGGELSLANSKLSNNSATSYGGGLYMGGGSSGLVHVEFVNNLAGHDGNEIFVDIADFDATNLIIGSVGDKSVTGNEVEDAECESSCAAGQYGDCELIGGTSSCYVNCECFNCPAGTALATSGATSSSDCASCATGSYSSSDGAVECFECANGTYASDSASNTDGGISSQVTSGATICNACPAGYYSSATAAIMCVACEAGSWTGVNGRSYCLTCPAGQYSIGGSAACAECSAGQYSNAARSSSCTSCDAHSSSSAGATECIVDEGYYKRNHYETKYNKKGVVYVLTYYKVLECPKGGYCAGGDAYPVPAAHGYGGYYDIKNASNVQRIIFFNIFECSYPNNCPIKKYDSNQSSCLVSQPHWNCSGRWILCGDGVQGNFQGCIQCEDSYHFSTVTLKCEKCSWNVLILMLTYCALFFVILAISLLLKYQATTSMVPQWLLKMNIWSMIKVMHNNGSLYVLFSTYQIIQSISYSLGIIFPSPFNKLLLWLSFFNFDIPGIGCYVKSDTLDTRPRWPLFLPLAAYSLILLMTMVYFWNYYYVQDKQTRLQLKSQYWRRLLYIAYFVTPYLTKNMFDLYNCDFGYLHLFNPQCYIHYERYYPPGILVLIYVGLFSIFPLVWTCILWRQRSELFPVGIDDDRLIAKIRHIHPSLHFLTFLFERYRIQLPYWEVVDIYRRVIFISIIKILSESILRRCWYGLVFALAFMVMYREVSPHLHPATTFLSNVGNLVIVLMYGGSLAIQSDLGAGSNSFVFGLVLCFVNFGVLGTSLFSAYIKTVHDRKALEFKRSALVNQLEWACNFSENKFKTTFDTLNDTVIPPSYAAVFYYASLIEIKQLLRHGIPVARGVQGITFSTHHPHHLTDTEKDLFGSLEAFVVCSLPRRLLQGSGESSLLTLPSSILRAMRGNYFGEVIDPRPWEDGAIMLPYTCIKRAYQLEETCAIDNRRSEKDEGLIRRCCQGNPISNLGKTPINISNIELSVSFKEKDGSCNTDTPETSVLPIENKPLIQLTILDKVETFCSIMSSIRESCSSNHLLPLYHYTSASIAPLILNGGLRMSSQGQGDGGVYFSTLSPASYGIGTDKYEENIVIDCFGKERFKEYLGKGKLDVCLVYAVEPMIVEQAPGGRDNAMVVHKDFFEIFSLPHQDGSYFLSPYRLMAAFLIEPNNPKMVKEVEDNEALGIKLDLEKANDVEVQQSLKGQIGSPI